MYPRTEYEMTQEDLDTLMEAFKPVPMIMLQCGNPPSQQENANRAWAALGVKMGFDGDTVRPVNGKGNRFFTAVPSETESVREERLAKEDEVKRQAEIASLTQEIEERQQKTPNSESVLIMTSNDTASPATIAYQQVKEALEFYADANNYAHEERINGRNYITWTEGSDGIAIEALTAMPALMPVEGSEISDIKVLGLNVQEIARLKSWFENKSGKNITEFWEEAFNAGVKTARFMSQPEPVSSPASISKAAWRIADLDNTIFKNTRENCLTIAKYAFEGAGVEQPDEWADKADQWQAAIDNAHPTKTGKYKTYEKALEMVSNRHSKGALVDLVNWLLAYRRPTEAGGG